MPFQPGQVITRRYFRGPHMTWVQPLRTIADDEQGLLLWHPVGSDIAQFVDADGKTPHDVPINEMREPFLRMSMWAESDILVLMPPRAAYSVWWLFKEHTFTGWYINLEVPYTRRPDGVDTADLLLDIVVTPDRQWQWKDVDEFEERTGNPLYFDKATADEVRIHGAQAVKLVESGAFPFDGTHTDFRPDPRWPRLALDNDYVGYSVA